MQYFGKYRGKVVDNVDPLQQGRVKVSVPYLLGTSEHWAMACVPYAGPKVGLFLLPPIGANVWVEFEGGNLDYPIWTGCFWGAGEVPVNAASSDIKVLKTTHITLQCDDTPDAGGFSLTVSPPLTPQVVTIKINQEGIELNNNPASVKLAASGISINLGSQSIQLSPASISLNNGALEVI